MIKTRKSQTKKRQGFTLIELLVVVSIIGILAALIVANFVGARGRAGDAAKKSNARQLKTALQLYYNDFQNYPDMTNGLDISGCGANGTTACGGWGAQFAAGAGPTVYIKDIPQDLYYYSDGANEFLVRAQLENASDADILESQNKCSPASRSYYGGTPSNLDFFFCED